MIRPFETTKVQKNLEMRKFSDGEFEGKFKIYVCNAMLAAWVVKKDFQG